MFLSLNKAFDTVSHTAVWKLLTKFGCPDKSINIVWQFHEGMDGKVSVDGDLTDPFPVTNGVK